MSCSMNQRKTSRQGLGAYRRAWRILEWNEALTRDAEAD